MSAHAVLDHPEMGEHVGQMDTATYNLQPEAQGRDDTESGAPTDATHRTRLFHQLNLVPVLHSELCSALCPAALESIKPQLNDHFHQCAARWGRDRGGTAEHNESPG